MSDVVREFVTRRRGVRAFAWLPSQPRCLPTNRLLSVVTSFGELVRPQPIGLFLCSSGAWTRTTIQGFKVLCPAIRRHRKNFGQDSYKATYKPSMPDSLGVSFFSVGPLKTAPTTAISRNFPGARAKAARQNGLQTNRLDDRRVQLIPHTLTNRDSPSVRC